MTRIGQADQQSLSTLAARLGGGDPGKELRSKGVDLYVKESAAFFTRATSRQAHQTSAVAVVRGALAREYGISDAAAGRMLADVFGGAPTSIRVGDLARLNDHARSAGGPSRSGPDPQATESSEAGTASGDAGPAPASPRSNGRPGGLGTSGASDRSDLSYGFAPDLGGSDEVAGSGLGGGSYALLDPDDAEDAGKAGAGAASGSAGIYGTAAYQTGLDQGGPSAGALGSPGSAYGGASYSVSDEAAAPSGSAGTHGTAAYQTGLNQGGSSAGAFLGSGAAYVGATSTADDEIITWATPQPKQAGAPAGGESASAAQHDKAVADHGEGLRALGVRGRDLHPAADKTADLAANGRPHASPPGDEAAREMVATRVAVANYQRGLLRLDVPREDIAEAARAVQREIAGGKPGRLETPAQEALREQRACGAVASIIEARGLAAFERYGALVALPGQSRDEIKATARDVQRRVAGGASPEQAVADVKGEVRDAVAAHGAALEKLGVAEDGIEAAAAATAKKVAGGVDVAVALGRAAEAAKAGEAASTGRRKKIDDVMTSFGVPDEAAPSIWTALDRGQGEVAAFCDAMTSAAVAAHGEKLAGLGVGERQIPAVALAFALNEPVWVENGPVSDASDAWTQFHKLEERADRNAAQTAQALALHGAALTERGVPPEMVGRVARDVQDAVVGALESAARQVAASDARSEMSADRAWRSDIGALDAMAGLSADRRAGFVAHGVALEALGVPLGELGIAVKATETSVGRAKDVFSKATASSGTMRSFVAGQKQVIEQRGVGALFDAAVAAHDAAVFDATVGAALETHGEALLAAGVRERDVAEVACGVQRRLGQVRNLSPEVARAEAAAADAARTDASAASHGWALAALDVPPAAIGEAARAAQDAIDAALEAEACAAAARGPEDPAASGTPPAAMGPPTDFASDRRRMALTGLGVSPDGMDRALADAGARIEARTDAVAQALRSGGVGALPSDLRDLIGAARAAAAEAALIETHGPALQALGMPTAALGGLARDVERRLAAAEMLLPEVARADAADAYAAEALQQHGHDLEAAGVPRDVRPAAAAAIRAQVAQGTDVGVAREAAVTDAALDAHGAALSAKLVDGMDLDAAARAVQADVARGTAPAEARAAVVAGAIAEALRARLRAA